MTKFTLYASIIARIIIILVGYLFSAAAFLFQIIGQIGELYLTAFFLFLSNTQALLNKLEKQK